MPRFFINRRGRDIEFVVGYRRDVAAADGVAAGYVAGNVDYFAAVEESAWDGIELDVALITQYVHKLEQIG